MEEPIPQPAAAAMLSSRWPCEHRNTTAAVVQCSTPLMPRRRAQNALSLNWLRVFRKTDIALAKVYGNSGIRRRYGQKNACYVVPEHGRGMRLIAMFFRPHAPEAQTARLSILSLYFKR